MSLLDRIHEIDKSEPYFWKLRLTAKEYAELQKHVAVHTDDALAVMAYLAEWYKREYTGLLAQQTPKAINLDSVQLEKLWHDSGIDIDTFVYRTDSGAHLWLYSIYVLGGLPIQHELSRNDKGRFLKKLCRIYHGEDEEIDASGTTERAIAFKESIAQRKSLYYYLRSILNDKFDDQDPQAKALVEAIRKANEDELRTKFRLEWIIRHNPLSKTFGRQLRIWLRPEETGTGLHQYVRHDRLAVWGISNPEDISDIRFSLRWICGKEVVQDASPDRTFLLFNNAGAHGFLANGVDKMVNIKAIPCMPFDRIEIVAYDQEGKCHVVQSENVEGYMQVWQNAESTDEWSSFTSSQHATAVIYRAPWHGETEPDVNKQFTLETPLWHWNYILTSICLTNDQGKSVSFYNRIGHDQPYIQLYCDTIHYFEGDKIKCFKYDEEENDYIPELLPLIFGIQDVKVRHFSSKVLDEAEINDKEPDAVEFKQTNGHYLLWTPDNPPHYGIISLRITEKGTYHFLKVIYLPRLNDKNPIERHLDPHVIKYRSLNGEVIEYHDTVPLDFRPLDPAVKLKFEFGYEQYAEVEVWRPANITEVWLDDQLYAYHLSVNLPYILKRRTQLRIFNQHGFRTYDCIAIPSIFPLLNDGITNYQLSLWENGASLKVKDLDPLAPENLSICIGMAGPNNPKGVSLSKIPKDVKFFYWDMTKEDEPIEVPYDYDQMSKKDSILFQSMMEPGQDLLCIAPRTKEHDRFRGRNVSEVRCYEVATYHKIPFFSMEPLRRMVIQGATKEKLINPLLEKRGGLMNQEDLDNLARFVDEFQLDPLI